MTTMVIQMNAKTETNCQRDLPQTCFAASYGVCPTCLKRVKLSAGATLGTTTCTCGGVLASYALPAELEVPARGIPMRLICYWVQGREDGFWSEHRLVWVSMSQRERVDTREAQRAYAAGRRVGFRLRGAIGPAYARTLKDTLWHAA